MRVKTPVYLQNETAECGATALRIILAYHRCFVDPTELRVACGVSRDGVTSDHLVNAARTYGLQARGFRKLANSLKALKPPFIAFMAFNHFIVIEGFSGSTVHINDPASGRRHMDRHSFDRQFTGIVFTFESTPTFKRRGHPHSFLSRLIPYIKASTGTLGLLGVIATLFTLPSLAYPALLRSFIDHVLLYSSALFPPLLLVTLLMLGLNMGLAFLQHHLMQRIENQLTVIHAARLMWQLLHLPDSFFTQRSVGEIGARFDLVDSLNLFFAQDAVRFACNGLLIGAYLIVLGIYHPVLPVLSGGLLAVYSLFASLLNRHMRESASVWQSNLDKLAGTAIHSLQNIEHVKANGTEADVFTRLVSYYTNMQNAAQSLNLSLRLLKSVLMGITSLNTVIIFAFGAVQVQAGLWSISAFAAVYLMFLSLWNAATGLTGFSGRAARLETDINRLEDVLHEQPQPRPHTLSRDDGNVEIKALTFGYKRLDRPLLDNINLTIPSGKSIGLVGASGSGKTTLARLIAGVYQPQAGEIQRGHIAIVDQDIFLFEGTIRENLTFWNEAISYEAILRATQDAEIDSEIQRLPQAYDTLLTEHGRNLSGGQRQRVQIARALAADPAVLILDEATSALDPVLEERVLANIRQRGCTLLIVSHRWSAIQGCDEIWVMENGSIVERGTHADLWQKSLTYTQLIQTPQHVNPLEYTSPESATVQPVASISTRNLTTALHMLTSLVDQPTENFWDGLAAQDAMMAACTIIGREMGFAVHQPQTDQPDRISAIAEASHVYMRRVQLPSDWWRQDCGPFIAHRGGTTMAFVRREQHYEAVDMASRQMIPINAASAADIETTVYQFYPALLDDRVTLRAFIQFIARNHLDDWRILIVCGVLMALLQMIPAFLMGVFFDTALPEAHMSLIGQIILALLTSSGVLALFAFVQETALIRIQTHTDFVIQSGLWTRLLSLSPAFFRQFSAGDLVMRVIGSRDALQNMTLTLINGVFYVLSWMVALIGLMTISPSLAGVGLLLTAAYLVALLWIGQGFARCEGAAADQRGRNSGWMAVILQGVNHLQITGAVERVFSVWAERFTLARRATQQSRHYESHLHVLNSVYPLLALLALFLNIMSGSGLSLGAFMTAQIIFLYHASIITQIGTVTLSMLRLIPSYQRLMPILNAVPETRPGQPPAHTLQGEIVLQDVTFRYHAARQPALQNLSLHIQAGEFVAVVGPSGSGKSTLLRVLLGFESPESGIVYYDQQSLAHVDPRTIRSQIGTVLQHHNLIYGSSIFNNLVGTRRTTHDEAWAALRFAGLDDDVKALPMGIHTLLTEGGRALSAGQRQRLLIARAVVHHPRLLFFDEATSALDDQTQAVLINHLSAFKITRVVIAHRLSTVLQADRIIVLDKGQVVESGTYDALIAQQGLFAEFARRQLLS